MPLALSPASVSALRNRVANGNFAIGTISTASATVFSAGAYMFGGWVAGSGGCTATWGSPALDRIVTISAGSMVNATHAGVMEGGGYTLAWIGTAMGRINGGAYSLSQLNLVLPQGVSASVEFAVGLGLIGTVGLVQLEPGLKRSAFERLPTAIETLRV